MNVSNDFNLSGHITEKQKLEIEERDRINKVAEIKSTVEQRKANTMLNNRDHLVQQIKDDNEAKINDAIVEEVRKKAQSKPELHLKPPIGAGQYTPQQREAFIKTQVRNNLGKKLEEGVQAIEAGENKKIDEFVSKVRAKEQERTPEGRRKAPTTHIDGVEVQEVNKEADTRSTGRTQRQFKDNASEITNKRRPSSGRGRGGRKRTRD